MNKKLHVKRDDTVLILSGVDRGKKGKVLEVSASEGKVIVEGRNMVKRHVKPRKMGDPGGIIDAPAPMYASKVQVICSHCNKPARLGHRKEKDGTKSRICKKCGESL